MNINKILVPQVETTNITKINTRGRVDTGTFCNAKCSFCYYRDKLNSPHKDKQLIKEEIKQLVKAGIREFDLSGGESSTHPDFIELIKFAKKYGKVTTISNGIEFANLKFLKKCICAGLTGIMFSLHGHDKTSHNKLVGTDSFAKIIHSINNLKKLKSVIKLEFRINCTVTNNFDGEKYLKLIQEIKPDQLNFLPLNYWEHAIDQKEINYEKVSKEIKYVIDNLKDQMDIRVRYIPFCHMVGYEKYVYGIYQHIFDLTDWNIQTYYDYQIKIDSSRINTYSMFDKAYENRLSAFKKDANCLKCKYILICDGIEKKLSTDQCISQPGETIKDINYEK